MPKWLTRKTFSGERPERVADVICKLHFIKIRSHCMGRIMHKGALCEDGERLFFTDTQPEDTGGQCSGMRFSALQKSAGLPPNGSASLYVKESVA